MFIRFLAATNYRLGPLLMPILAITSSYKGFFQLRLRRHMYRAKGVATMPLLFPVDWLPRDFFEIFRVFQLPIADAIFTVVLQVSCRTGSVQGETLLC